MNKRNKVKQLNKTAEHRNAMINNMITSLFRYERIESTVAKIKVIRSHAEKLITRAKSNIDLDMENQEQKATAIHNKRLVMKKINDEKVINKLFDDIAPRFKEVNGGYTRIIKLVNRASDNSEVGILELVKRKTREELAEEKRVAREENAAKQKERKKELKEKRVKAKEKK
ncbi:MAG: 50S ribosomal protein L17 [Leptospiraceae bacterium]|nr:50S ribosomal protein L17 [Leptospiraceae bacterium]